MTSEVSVQKRFDYYTTSDSKNPFNRRIGDFLYIHAEANPSWYYYFDRNGNSVMYGGRGHYTDVKVEIKVDPTGTLKSRLLDYLKELVERHGEVLHEEGEKLYRGVTIRLPYVPYSSYYEAVVHTGSGCWYDQDEIAYEVMAALSGVPVYKAMAPFGQFYGFERVDKLDDAKPVVFYNARNDVQVFFSHENDNSFVNVLAPKTEDFERFMFALFARHVESKLGCSFERVYGERTYTNGEVGVDSESLDVKIAPESDGSKCLFGMKCPYNLSYEDLPRLRFARLIMESYSENFLRQE